ncbi:MAG: hypothetical protein GXO18_02985 [Aquificae bacterium]|nr:hypothetical protein [Aquificota bacterium]
MALRGITEQDISLVINRWVFTVWEFENVFGSIPERREEVYFLGLDNHEEVKKFDRILFRHLKDYLRVATRVYKFPIQGDPNQPLEKWWWHLNKIAKGEFPIEKLPEHLKEIYREKYLD